MNEKPRRKYDLTLTIGADDFAYLLSALNEIAADIEQCGDAPYETASGGYSGNSNVKLVINHAMTHDIYFDQLEAHIVAEEAKYE